MRQAEPSRFKPKSADHARDNDITEITEGTTKLLVPRGSLAGAVPSRKIAFYNPRASINRDIAVAAYAASLEDFKGPRIILEPLAGVGATGVRAASEHPDADTSEIQHIYQNDANPSATHLAKESATLNSASHMISVTNQEACRFLAHHTTRETRGAIVDIDPFGSPAPFFDCATRSVFHGGMIACTATDLQVLNGLFDDACQNRYGSMPIRGTTYGGETAIRIVLGCLRSVAARLDASIHPLLVSSHMHYYRMYVRVRMGHAGMASDEIGYLKHCDACGRRRLASDAKDVACDACGAQKTRIAGPLWTGRIFDEQFALRTLKKMRAMQSRAADSTVYSNTAQRILKCAADESAVAAVPFYTTDEIASRMRVSPPRIADAIERLRDAGHAASQTCMSPTGFRTDAPIDVICGVFADCQI